jgi:hypothetical protein
MTDEDKKLFLKHHKNLIKEEEDFFDYEFKQIFLGMILFTITCYAGFALSVLTKNLLYFPFFVITLFLIVKYKVVLEYIGKGELVSQIKVFIIFFIIDIILLLFIIF